MDLKSGYPFWAIKNGLIHAFPRLEHDATCDAAIIGGGISGALIANELAEHGHAVAVLEQRDIGWGSSAASTALLQYEIDTHMTELAERFGESDAVLAYQGCARSITQLQRFAREIRDVDFRSARSLYYASRRRDVATLQAELALRRKHGFAACWVGAAALREGWGIVAPGAILTELAASMDPYRMAYRLLVRLEKRGSGVFDRTCVEHVEPTSRGVTLCTVDDACVRAKFVVLAAGYASQLWLQQKVARNHSSYAFITDPMDAALLRGLRDTLVWESARPYLYLRSTGDGRLLVGGEDDAIDIPARRDARVERKAARLVKKAAKAMPGLDLTPTFAWGGTFAETDDGLPFFGPHAQHGPRVLFAMAYGGNGITYSMLGAGLIRAYIERSKHPLANLFSFARLER